MSFHKLSMRSFCHAHAYVSRDCHVLHGMQKLFRNGDTEIEKCIFETQTSNCKRGSRYLSRGGGGGGGGVGWSHRKRTRLIIRYFDFRISMDVSLLQEKSTFPVLTMRTSPHLELFFFLIYDCILNKCCAISNQYHFTNPNCRSKKAGKFICALVCICISS